MATDNKKSGHRLVFAGRDPAAKDIPIQKNVEPQIKQNITSATPNPSPKQGKEGEDVMSLRRRLFLRLSLAAIVMILLLGAVFGYEYYGKPSPAKDLPVEAAVEAPVKVEEPIKPIEPPPTEIKAPVIAEVTDDAPPAVPEMAQPPVDSAAPPDLPPPPEVAAKPTLAKQSGVRGSDPKGRSANPRLERETPVSSSRNQPRVSETTTIQAPTENIVLAPPRLLSGYAVQAGVFADAKKAEELHAKLALHGIPSSIEARVQVGPFKNKAEAEAAKAKLQALGISAVMLPKGSGSRQAK